MKLAAMIFLIIFIIAFVVIVSMWLRSTSGKPQVVMCGCGALPVHTPDIPSCRAVNEAQGRIVTENGIVISRDGRLFFDGVDWYVNPDIKVRRRA